MSDFDRLLDGLAPGWQRQLEEVLGSRIDSERNRALRDEIMRRFLAQGLPD